MFISFDKMFDFNHDGRLDSFESAAQLQFLDEMSQEEETSMAMDEDETDEDKLEAAGLDYDELADMDPSEREEALEDAGLDPDDFDF